MPVLASSYQPPAYLALGHLQTVLPTLFRKGPAVDYRRRELTLPDGDFLDLDWAQRGNRRLGIVCHGLEGDAQRAYVRGMVGALLDGGWDALGMNYRGCGGRPNRKACLYHSGATHDLAAVVAEALAQGYEALALIGFSLGGNLVLKYLGEVGGQAPPELKAGVAFSVPCDLADSNRRMALLQNRLYIKRFLRLLHDKIKAKMGVVPGALDDNDYQSIKGFSQFDDRYTAPLHGFADAADYYRRASSRPGLPAITVPTLLVNALDDPLLGPACFPWAEAQASPCFHLEAPAHGGHVGFMAPGGRYWSETRALEFLARWA